MGVHSRQHWLFRCHGCRNTFTQSHGTPLYRLKTDRNVVMLILTLLLFGNAILAIVMAFKVDKRTLADWRLVTCSRALHLIEETKGSGAPSALPSSSG